MTKRRTTRVVGRQHANADGTSRQEAAARCRKGETLLLVREPSNRFDPNAVAVFSVRGEQLGYLPAKVAAELVMSSDVEWFGCVKDLVPHHFSDLASDRAWVEYEVVALIATEPPNPVTAAALDQASAAFLRPAPSRGLLGRLWNRLIS